MVGLTSAVGVVGLLAEPDPEVQIFALRRLSAEIDTLWTETIDAIGQIEALYEDPQFPERELAALVAAKIYYHLQEYNESMMFALGAGSHFDIERAAEFEETIISKCIDSYISHAQEMALSHGPTSPTELESSFPTTIDGAANVSAGLASPTMPFSQASLPSKSLLSRQDSNMTFATSGQQARLNASDAIRVTTGSFGALIEPLKRVVDRVFARCFEEKQYRQVVGIAVEARNLDVVRRAITQASQQDKQSITASEKSPGHAVALLQYLLDICMDVVQERSFRQQVLKLVLDLLNQIDAPDVFSIAKCIIYLDEAPLAAKLLVDLVRAGSSQKLAEAYQVAFDLYDNSAQEFLSRVRDHLPNHISKSGQESESHGAQVNGVSNGVAKEAESDKSNVPRPDNPDTTKPSPTEKIVQILEGKTTIALNAEFLYRHNHADKAILTKLKDSLEARNSIFHTAVTLSCGFMNVGTLNDSFYRDNLEWLGKAVNWSKFTATASLGVIHRGNLGAGQRILQPYLPKENSATPNSIYSQGGALYAMGLIYANHKTDAIDNIWKHFKAATEEVVQHGGALGLGVAGMATGDEDIYEDLKNVLWSDSAINGEAVGIAMGLIMLGSGNIKALEDMIQYAHDTQHEKIVRGLGLGMALIMYGRQEGADELVNGLLDDADPILRYGGVQTLALAYCGTASNKAVRRLLHVAVSDVNDDVRRYAVMSLGFILFRKPKSVPRMVELLAESYNPHVRYGAAMALGISCAGTGLDEAIHLLEPMMKDTTDFVRQGALVALSMIMIQQNEAMNPKVTDVRKALTKAVGDRHEDAMTKFGSAIAMGIIDAGGRNCTINMQTQTGNLNMPAIVGMMIFTQYWYWFPLTHFLSLSFSPTTVVALDPDLEVPDLKYHSATRSNLFDYPPEQETKVEGAPEKVKTAVLSTTAQAKRRAQKKEKQQQRDTMDVDQEGNMDTDVMQEDKTAADVGADDGADGDKMDIEKTSGQEAVNSANNKTSGKSTKDHEKDDGSDSADKAEDPKDKLDINGTSTSTSTAPLKSRADREQSSPGYLMENVSRVLSEQLKFITFPDTRYRPVKKATGGVLLMDDLRPDEAKKLLEMKRKQPRPQPSTTGATDTATPATDSSAENTVNGTSSSGQTDGRNTNDANTQATDQAMVIDESESTSGAEIAAPILTAMDEDEAGQSDAECPDAFDYYPSDDNEDGKDGAGDEKDEEL